MTNDPPDEEDHAIDAPPWRACAESAVTGSPSNVGSSRGASVDEQATTHPRVAMSAVRLTNEIVSRRVGPALAAQRTGGEWAANGPSGRAAIQGVDHLSERALRRLVNHLGERRMRMHRQRE